MWWNRPDGRHSDPTDSSPVQLRQKLGRTWRRWLAEFLLPAKPPPVAVGIGVAVALILAETAVLALIKGNAPEVPRGTIYLLGVLVVSSVWGAGLGVASAVASTIAFNYFHVGPFGELNLTWERDVHQAVVFSIAALLVSGLASLARSRALEASQRTVEADVAADIARIALSHDDPRPALELASRLVARQFGLSRAAIEVEGVAAGDAEDGAGERDVVFPLGRGADRVGRLRVPADVPAATRERIEHRLVPSLEAIIRAARDRQKIVGSLRVSQRETAGLLEEQAALRRVATLVAAGSAPAEVFASVTAELHHLFEGFSTALIRYEPDGTVTSVSGRDESGRTLSSGMKVPLSGENVTGAILRTGRAARIDSYDTATGPIAETLRERGVHSGLGVPILVEGALWGVTLVMSAKQTRIPDDAEARLRGFTELVATAIANAENRAELVASRVRLVAAADDARRRIERDLHDGAQQRIVSLALELRLAEQLVPDGQSEMKQLLSHTVKTLTEIHDGLCTLSRGIHPALLSQGGIAPMIRTLARRSTVPVGLDLNIDQRLPERVEVAVYYVVSEALTNVAKHGQASEVRVTAQADEQSVRLSVRDDGVGGADPGAGTGLVGLRDRVEALGGHMTVVSTPGRGTTLAVEIPIADPVAASPNPHVVHAHAPIPSRVSTTKPGR